MATAKQATANRQNAARSTGLYEEFGGISPSWVVLGDGPIEKPDLEETP